LPSQDVFQKPTLELGCKSLLDPSHELLKVVRDDMSLDPSQDLSQQPLKKSKFEPSEEFPQKPLQDPSQSHAIELAEELL